MRKKGFDFLVELSKNIISGSIGIVTQIQNSAKIVFKALLTVQMDCSVPILITFVQREITKPGSLIIVTHHVLKK